MSACAVARSVTADTRASYAARDRSRYNRDVTRRARTTDADACARSRRPTASSSRSALRISTGAVRSLGRPGKRPVLEPLVEHPEARPIPREDLEPVAATIAKEKEMARQRVEREALAHQRGQPVDRSPQIGRARREVDPDGRRDRQHVARSAATTARTRSADAPGRTCSAPHR